MRISDWSSDVCSSDLLGEVRIGLQLEHRQRAHLVARSAAVAGAAPAIMFGFGEAAGVTLLLGLARLGFLVAQAFEIIPVAVVRSEEHTSELQSLMRISYAVFCLKTKTTLDTTYGP